MNDKIGIAGSFFFFTVCSLIGLIFTIKFVKETKGKSKEEIEDM